MPIEFVIVYSSNVNKCIIYGKYVYIFFLSCKNINKIYLHSDCQCGQSPFILLFIHFYYF